MPDEPGIHDGRLAPCPSAPRCVSSDARDPSHRADPLVLEVEPEEAWRAAVSAVAAMPRTSVVTRTDDYLHAECRSAVFGFVDDLELHLRADEGIIAVRSASRLGYYDFGVNRRRVEKLRDLMRRSGAVM